MEGWNSALRPQMLTVLREVRRSISRNRERKEKKREREKASERIARGGFVRKKEEERVEIRIEMEKIDEMMKGEDKRSERY